MSDSYEFHGVKITPAAGGYYDLSHSSLTGGEPERVRGKEKAEERAKAIAEAAKQPEGHIEQQGAIEQAKPIAADVETAVTAAQKSDGAEPGEGEKSQADKDAEEIATLKAALKTSEARAEDLAKAAKPIVTVVTEAAAEEAPTAPLATVLATREFRGQMDPKTRAALKKLGVEVKTIVLEENESIPPTGLFVGHNGKSYMILPGEEVDVPDFILGVLRDAVMATPTVDPKTQKVLGYRNRSKYPYREV